MKKPWILPLIILLALCGAWIFRWDYTATKTKDTSVLKWKTDRWTGQNWVEIYTPTKIYDRPLNIGTDINKDTVINQKNGFTTAWRTFVIVTASWLGYSIVSSLKIKKE